MFFQEKRKRDKRRAFTQTQKNEIWEQQGGRCASSRCNHSKLDLRTVEYDHKKPWALGGRTIKRNGRALCPNCHKRETFEKRLKNVEKRPKKDTSIYEVNIKDITLPKLKKGKGGFSLI